MTEHKLNEADLLMAIEMFDASPDGQAEQRRVAEIIAALPDGHITVTGYWLGECTGRSGCALHPDGLDLWEGPIRTMDGRCVHCRQPWPCPCPEPDS